MRRKINIVVIGGIRTHYIKINAIQKTFMNLSETIKNRFNITYINTAQHYDKALVSFIDELSLRFDYTLTHNSKDSFEILSSMFSNLGKILDIIMNKHTIDYVMVMGDVSTTAVASLVTITKKVKLIHIEAGVRIGRGVGNEEYFRIAADHYSDLCFASTRLDFENLCKEGLQDRSFFSGDIILDYLSNLEVIVEEDFNYFNKNGKLCSYKSKNSDFILTSLHHEENISKEVVQNLFEACFKSGYNSIFIAHPRILKLIRDNNINTYKTIISSGIPYLENLKAIKKCCFVITDSGGIQRESYYLDKRCIVRSSLCVWQPIIDSGSNITIGKTLNEILDGIKWAEENLTKEFRYNQCFGNGSAVKKIFEYLLYRSPENNEIV